jgi:hypothetical protein
MALAFGSAVRRWDGRPRAEASRCLCFPKAAASRAAGRVDGEARAAFTILQAAGLPVFLYQDQRKRRADGLRAQRSALANSLLAIFSLDLTIGLPRKLLIIVGLLHM